MIQWRTEVRDLRKGRLPPKAGRISSSRGALAGCSRETCLDYIINKIFFFIVFLFSFFAHRTLNNNLWLQYIDLVWVSTQFSSGPYKSTITVGLVSSRHIPIQQQQQLERERQLNRRYLQSISYKQI